MTRIIITLALLFTMYGCFVSGYSDTPETPQLESDLELMEEELELAEEIIIDSDMTFEDAISGTAAPQEIIDQLVLLDVEYYSFDNKLHRGQLLLNRAIEPDVYEIFTLIKEIRFPIGKAIPIVVYNWEDDLSMADNNTSAFCYRKVAGTNSLSRHAYGKAIDINPFLNPLVWKAPYEHRKTQPAGGVYNPDVPGTLHADHPVVREFIKRKFRWGRYFIPYYDNHHFHRD